MKFTIAAFILVFGLTTAALGQEARTVTVTRPPDAKVRAEIIAANSTKVVKGAPFSAEAVSESVQTLADGNKITRTVTTKLYRDGEGRFRREEAAGSAASAMTLFSANPAISIFDPVAGVRYVLNPTDKTAARFKLPNRSVEGAVIMNGNPLGEARRYQVESAAVAAAGRGQAILLPGLIAATASGNGRGGGKTESLGTRNIEGVQAEGTRTVTTIEAGKIGNERPIEIVYERWYSKDLQMIVYSKHSDPRFGEQTYRLTNINLGEPDRALFTLPADYKINAEPPIRLLPAKP